MTTEFLELLRALAAHRVELRVLDLAAVIESKQIAGRDKDKAMLPVLRRTLEVRRADVE